MNRKYNKLISENLLLGFLILMIVPFLFLFLYNHPYNDDLTLGYVFKTKGFFTSQIYSYMRWSGRYFSNAMMGLNPLMYGSIGGYKFVTFLLTLVFFFILYIFVSEFTKKLLNFKERVIITFSILFLYLYSMPSISEGLYWLPSSINYQIGISTIFVFLILYSRINDPENTSSKSFLTFLAVIVLIAMIGCTEMTMFAGVLIMTLITFSKLKSGDKLDARLILFIFTTVVFTIILIAAPGNSFREAQFTNNHQFIPTIRITFLSVVYYLFNWVIKSPLFFVTLLLLPVINKLAANNGKKSESIFLNPVFTSLGLLALVIVYFVIPVWSLGRVPFERTINYIYIVFLIGWFYNVYVLLIYFSKNDKFNIERIPKYYYTIAMVIVVLFLVIRNNVKDAYSDLFKGRAAAFNKELNDRYEFIYNSPSDTVVVEPLKNIPYTIYLGDISSDPKERLNLLYAQYFYKKSIFLSESDSLEKK